MLDELERPPPFYDSVIVHANECKKRGSVDGTAKKRGRNVLDSAKITGFWCKSRAI